MPAANPGQRTHCRIRSSIAATGHDTDVELEAQERGCANRAGAEHFTGTSDDSGLYLASSLDLRKERWSLRYRPLTRVSPLCS